MESRGEYFITYEHGTVNNTQQTKFGAGSLWLWSTNE